jgi:hypothetical protein
MLAYKTIAYSYLTIVLWAYSNLVGWVIGTSR